MIKVAQIGTSLNSHGNGIWDTMKKFPDLFQLVGYAFPENEREKFLIEKPGGLEPEEPPAVFSRLANDKNFPIGVLFDWKVLS